MNIFKRIYRKITIGEAFNDETVEALDEALTAERGEIDYEDDGSYAVVEYYDHEDGSSAEVYYSDEGKKEISDIRFGW